MASDGIQTWSEKHGEFLTKRNVRVNTMKWRIKSIFSYIIYTLLLLIYIPFFLFGVLNLGCLIVGMKIKRKFGTREGKMEGELGIASRKHGIIDMRVVNAEDEYDFLVNRSFIYIWRMCFWTPWELTLYFLKEQSIDLISDEQLAYVVLCTVFGHSVHWDKSRKMFHLCMRGIEDLQLFEGFFWEAREIFVSEDGSKIIIKMLGGQELHSDCEPELRPTFDLAKLHAQICLSFMGPGLSHNDVHFMFPSCMAVLAKKHLNHENVLYKLLSPHFRFTERINYQALRVQKATNNKRSKFDRLFFFWQPFPLIKEVFREAIAKKCKEYYIEKGSEEFEEETYAVTSEEEDVSNGIENGIKKTSISRTTRQSEIKRNHSIFPPDFVTDKERQKVPYLNFLAKYYRVIRRYVRDLEPFIDKKEWEVLSKEIAVHIPKFDRVPMTDAIASFILKVGVVHFCDHESYVRYFSYKYACMSMRTPFENFDRTREWDEICREMKVKLDAVKRDPISLIWQRDVLRTRCFLNIFVDFLENPKCNLFLADTDYGYEHFGPQMAEKNFKARLKALDEKLRGQDVIPHLPGKKDDEVRGQGMQLMPLKSIVRTVCY